MAKHGRDKPFPGIGRDATRGGGKKLAGTTRLIEMRITTKKIAQPRGSEPRYDRTARDVLLIGLCTLFLHALHPREKDRKRGRW